MQSTLTWNRGKHMNCLSECQSRALRKLHFSQSKLQFSQNWNGAKTKLECVVDANTVGVQKAAVHCHQYKTQGVLLTPSFHEPACFVVYTDVKVKLSRHCGLTHY